MLGRTNVPHIVKISTTPQQTPPLPPQWHGLTLCHKGCVVKSNGQALWFWKGSLQCLVIIQRPSSERCRVEALSLTTLFASLSIVLPLQWTPDKAPSSKNTGGPHCKTILPTLKLKVSFSLLQNVSQFFFSFYDSSFTGTFSMCRTTWRIDEEIVSIFGRKDQRPSQQSLALSQIAFEHFWKLFSTNQAIGVQKKNCEATRIIRNVENCNTLT